jgi:CubicO group peptidase (beta-lactamase class C family)
MTQPPLRSGTLADLRINPHRWSHVEVLTRRLAAEDALPAVAIQVLRDGHCLPQPLQVGRQRESDESADTLHENAIFLVASITKPVVAMAALRLVEQGEISLNDRIVDLLPEFDAPPRRPMTIRHLLTHTSGLPDMLPNNRKLRQENRPLPAFFEGTCAVTLDFPPGHGVQYQSMGFVLLAEIIHRISGRSCRQFVHDEILAPLQMHDSALGADESWFEGPAAKIDRLVEVRVPEDQQEGHDWNWNSQYWRQFGAPWGGLLASVNDIARLCYSLTGGPSPLSPATIAQMTSNQLHALASVSDVDRRTRGWGLGWRLNWPTHPATFGDLVDSEAVGHWGATGTVCWADRASGTGCVILTSQPLDRGRNLLVHLSNAIVSALE